MSKTPIRQVFLKVGTADKDHPWYRCDSEAGCEEMAEDPPGWAGGVREVTVPRQPALVLYRDRQDAGEIWGVSWGPVPSGELDVIGRGMRLRLLTWFAEAAEAGAFAAGVLEEWWARRGEGAAELGDAARRAVADPENGGALVWAFLEGCLRRWTFPSPPLPKPLLAAEPLLAQPVQPRLNELHLYLRGGADHFTHSPLAGQVAGQAAFLAVVVVTEGVVVTRLRSVWRALTDQAPSPDWTPFPAILPPARPPSDDPAIRPPGFQRRGLDWVLAIGHDREPDQGQTATRWLEEFADRRVSLCDLVAALAYRVQSKPPDLAEKIIKRVAAAASAVGYQAVLAVLEQIVVGLQGPPEGTKNQLRHALGGLTGDGVPATVRERASKLLESLGPH